jgi:hypothetical protein
MLFGLIDNKIRNTFNFDSLINKYLFSTQPNLDYFIILKKRLKIVI